MPTAIDPLQLHYSCILLSIPVRITAAILEDNVSYSHAVISSVRSLHSY